MRQLTKKEFEIAIQDTYKYTIKQLETLGFLNAPASTVIASYEINVKYHTWIDLLMDREIPNVLITITAKDK